MFKSLKKFFNFFNLNRRLKKGIKNNKIYISNQLDIIENIKKIKQNEIEKFDNNEKIEYLLTDILKEKYICKDIINLTGNNNNNFYFRLDIYNYWSDIAECSSITDFLPKLHNMFNYMFKHRIYNRNKVFYTNLISSEDFKIKCIINIQNIFNNNINNGNAGGNIYYNNGIHISCIIPFNNRFN